MKWPWKTAKKQNRQATQQYSWKGGTWLEVFMMSSLIVCLYQAFLPLHQLSQQVSLAQAKRSLASISSLTEDLQDRAKLMSSLISLDSGFLSQIEKIRRTSRDSIFAKSLQTILQNFGNASQADYLEVIQPDGHVLINWGSLKRKQDLLNTWEPFVQAGELQVVSGFMQIGDSVLLGSLNPLRVNGELLAYLLIGFELSEKRLLQWSEMLGFDLGFKLKSGQTQKTFENASINQMIKSNEARGGFFDFLNRSHFSSKISFSGYSEISFEKDLIFFVVAESLDNYKIAFFDMVKYFLVFLIPILIICMTFIVTINRVTESFLREISTYSQTTHRVLLATRFLTKSFDEKSLLKNILQLIAQDLPFHTSTFSADCRIMSSHHSSRFVCHSFNLLNGIVEEASSVSVLAHSFFWQTASEIHFGKQEDGSIYLPFSTNDSKVWGALRVFGYKSEDLYPEDIRYLESLKVSVDFVYRHICEYRANLGQYGSHLQKNYHFLSQTLSELYHPFFGLQRECELIEKSFYEAEYQGNWKEFFDFCFVHAPLLESNVSRLVNAMSKLSLLRDEYSNVESTEALFHN